MSVSCVSIGGGLTGWRHGLLYFRRRRRLQMGNKQLISFAISTENRLSVCQPLQAVVQRATYSVYRARCVEVNNMNLPVCCSDNLAISSVS
jgi:hypothetical protein